MSWCTIINHLRQSERSDLTPVELVWPCGRFIMQGQINWTWLQHRNKNHAAYIYVHWIPAADNERADADSLVTPLSTTRWWVIFLGVGTAWRIQFPRWSSPWFSCLLLGSMRGPIKRHTHFRVYFRMAKTSSHHTGHDSFFFQMIFVILFPFLFSPIKDKTPMWWGLDY